MGEKLITDKYSVFFYRTFWIFPKLLNLLVLRNQYQKN